MLIDWLLARIEEPTDRLIAWRNKRLLAAALRTHGSRAQYTVSETTQIQTPAGYRTTRRGELVQTALAPNAAMIPTNAAAMAIHRAWSRVAGSFVHIQGKPIAPTAAERAERVYRISASGHDWMGQ
jgi:hypothetical protein